MLKNVKIKFRINLNQLTSSSAELANDKSAKEHGPKRKSHKRNYWKR